MAKIKKKTSKKTATSRAPATKIISKKRVVKRVNWKRIRDSELLDMRMCDLPLRWDQSLIGNCIERLFAELKGKGLRVRPRVWFSDEWFCPDGVAGFAVTFYLAHPRLMRLEKRQMLEVEGGAEKWCMRILRHETGHVYDNAYRLCTRRKWKEIFGSSTKQYPKSYKPKPNSRNYVLHLDDWYAQAHPAEDFAETFAVWLAPRSRWKKNYADWPALEKLNYVDRLMREISDKEPAVKCREQVDRISTLKKTLNEHYQQRREYYGGESPDFYDAHLKRIFSGEESYSNNSSAVSFLRRYRKVLREPVADWTAISQYAIDQLLDEIIDRCKEMKLRCIAAEDQTKTQVILMLSVVSMNFIHSGHYQVML